MPDLLPVAALARPLDLFRCVPYAATITARACLGRRAETRGDGRPAHPTCAGCALGAEVAKRVTVERGPTCACGATVRGAKGRVPVCRACRRKHAFALGRPA